MTSGRPDGRPAPRMIVAFTHNTRSENETGVGCRVENRARRQHMAEPQYPQYLLTARSIVKSFGPTSVLKGFDLSIAAGEVHAFLGGNGAGKSTLIKIISGQFERDGGTLEFDGQAIGASVGGHVAAGTIAVVNQELALLPHLSVAENIA